MFVRGFEIVQDAYAKYAADGIVQVLFVCAITVLLIREKKSENKLLGHYSIILILGVCFPPIASVLTRVTGASVYWRVFWLVPSVIVIAFVGTKLAEQIGKKSKQGLFILTMVIVIVLGGKSMYQSENFTKSSNLYKIPQEAIDICEMIAPNDETPKIVVPETIVSYIRQYNPNIELLYGRDMGKDYRKGKRYRVLLQLNSEDPDYEYIAASVKENECEFVVFENKSNNLESMLNYGYELYGSTQNYTIFKSVEVLTQ